MSIIVRPWLCAVLVAVSLPVGAVAAPRSIPLPLAGHPGNVFLHGDKVTVRLPDDASSWTVIDYEGRELAHVAAGNRTAQLGALPVGFYRLRRDGSAEWVSLAVLEPLSVPTPLASPICVDVAMAWFYPTDRMAQVASLCALAGVNRVRDRLTWSDMEPAKGRFAPPNKYDESARIQSAAGLQVLQVNHSTPAWAGADGRRFPPDLRDAYTFYREMARRWSATVAAIEPWNEADIEGFGGHTGMEMAAMQKASYLGLKAGNPKIIACQNVFAVHGHGQLADFAANEAWPYFDTYDLHHYEGLEGYPRLYADHRAVSAGRPMWVTECAIPVKWAGDPNLHEPTEEDLRIQSERVGKVFAASLHEGSAATYYFILGHYVEGQTQFGIIRRDLTPRPAFLALAAAGRLLADAHPLGRLTAADGVSAYAFRAKPGGKEEVVLVAWTKEGTGSLDLGVAPEAVYDHLGRLRTGATAADLSTAPVYIVLPLDAPSHLALQAPPTAPRRKPGSPCSVVLQPVFPEDKTMLFQSAYRVASTQATDATLCVYNFGPSAIGGKVRTEAADGWRVEGLEPVSLEPMGRRELKIRYVPGSPSARSIETIRFVGDFGPAGRPVASARLAPDAGAMSRRPGIALAGARNPATWELMVSGGPTPTATIDGDGVTFEAAPSGDPWFYPRIRVSATQPVPPGAVGLACTITLLEGEGLFRVIFDEKNGSSYVADTVNPAKLGTPVETVALFDSAAHGDGWSAVDPNGVLDPPEIVTLKVGCNCKAGKVRFRVSNVRWVRP